MSYGLGVDVGTTFTAAAICRPGEAPETVRLSNESAVLPSVVALAEDGSWRCGHEADRLAMNTPRRAARHFKRRLGDDVPLVLGTTPVPAQALTGRLVAHVREIVEERFGAPDAVVLTHPANWADYRKEVFSEAARSAGWDDVVLVTEPGAAAAEYAASVSLDAGAKVVVYDLGGGTFDAVVMVVGPEGFEVVGSPQGADLGGIDFDDAIWRFVTDAQPIDGLDPDDPAWQRAGRQLRAACTQAKHHLSMDVATVVAVEMPGDDIEVRLTRDEFETMVRPRLDETVRAVRRALETAEVGADDLHRILLVGGSSRVPLVSAELMKAFPVEYAIDDDPNHTIALGAARLAATALDRKGDPALPPPRLVQNSAFSDLDGPIETAPALVPAPVAHAEALPDELEVSLTPANRSAPSATAAASAAVGDLGESADPLDAVQLRATQRSAPLVATPMPTAPAQLEIVTPEARSRDRLVPFVIAGVAVLALVAMMVAALG